MIDIERATILQAANELLKQKRLESQEGRETAVPVPVPTTSTPPGRFFKPGRLTQAAEHTEPEPSMSAIFQTGGRSERAAGPSPSPLSWSLRNATVQLAALRATHGLQPPTAVSQPAPSPAQQITSPEETAVSQPAQETAVSSALVTSVKVWPGLGAAMKQNQFGPHYRLHVACQVIDPTGSGRVAIEAIRAAFTKKQNGRFLFSWRRVRQILNDGDGRFWNWNRKTDIIYLRSVTVLGRRVSLSRVDRAVMIPATAVFSGQGKFNAHLHAAWLTAHGGENKPISQAAITAATAVPGRTQRRYNRAANVRRRVNLEIGQRHTQETQQETAWQHGRASFEFVDAQGRQGKPGGRYRARRLPDSHQPRHSLAPVGRRRKINQSLASLVNNEEPGSSGERLTKRYFANGREAARAFNRHPNQAVYFPTGRAGDCSVWSVLSC